MEEKVLEESDEMKIRIQKDLYANPKYYDLAFCSFRDTKHEVDVIEECIHRYSRIPVKRVLEIACGPSPNLKELVQRGYERL